MIDYFEQRFISQSTSQRARYRELVEYCESRGIELPSRFLLPLEENISHLPKVAKALSPGDIEVMFPLDCIV